MYDDIMMKLKGTFGDDFPRVSSIDIYTEGTFVYGIELHYKGHASVVGTHAVEPMPEGVSC